MPSGSILVTGGDSAYFPLMRELIQSLQAKPECAGVTVGVLDCGLAPAEVDWCRAVGASVVEPSFDLGFGPGLSVLPNYRAITARPHLKRYFPGFETYLWLDADVWVQDWKAVALFLEAAHLGDVAIVPEMHRSYGNFRHQRDDFEQANRRAYADAFGAEAAARYIRQPLVNAGVFAIRATSPAWQVWADVMADVALRSTNMIDQIALNVAIQDHGLGDVRLPPTCNWIAHLATPAWDEAKQAVVEPDPPFEKLGIVHLTLATKWAGAIALPLAGRRAAVISRSLRYPG